MKKVALLVVRLVLGALFVFAGALKIRDPAAFAQEIANYEFFPALAPYLAVTLPPTEIVAGLALVFLPAYWRRGAALSLVGMAGMFTVALISVVVRGVNIDCGCFGSGSGPATWLTVGRGVAIMAASLVLVVAREKGSGLHASRL